MPTNVAFFRARVFDAFQFVLSVLEVVNTMKKKEPRVYVFWEKKEPCQATTTTHRGLGDISIRLDVIKMKTFRFSES